MAVLIVNKFLDYIWEKINILNKRFVVNLALGILTMVLGYNADIIFLYKKIEALQKQIANTEKQIQTKRQAISMEQGSKLLPAPLAERLVRPASGLEVISILEILENAVVAARVTSSLFESEALQEDEWFLIYPVKLEIKGTYKKLLMFINNVLRLPYLVTIEDLNLQKKKDDDADDLNMLVFLTVYKNKHSVAGKIKSASIHISERDIFKQEIYKKNLYLWLSKELQFLGLITQAKTTFGVVSDPMGGIYRVTIGDKIGLNQSKITAVDECSITTTKKEDNIYRGGKCI